MAIYSLNHSAIGKTTHAAGTAGAHVRYITRTQAQPEIVAHLVPEDRNAARAWMLRREETSRKNARVCDKLIIALPLELDAGQRRALLEDFAHRITEGRAPYFAAIHAAGKDAANPHAHLILVDRDPDTGKRVMLTTEKGSTERFRSVWEAVCNEHLQNAGKEARIDRRTLEAQGITREPQIHVGAEGQHVSDNVARPRSQAREFNNSAGAKSRTRQVDYEAIDQGRTRQEYNDQIVGFNLAEAARSPHFGTRKRAELATQLRAMKKRDEERFADTRRNITHQARDDRAQAWKLHRTALDSISAERAQRIAAARRDVKAEFAPAWKDHYDRKEQDLATFKADQRAARLHSRLARDAIKAMKRGQDYIPGHLKPIFSAVAQFPARLQALNEVETQRRQEIAAQHKEALAARLAEIRDASREAITAEKARHQGLRQEQQTSLRDQWKDFYRLQGEAKTARDGFQTAQEATIAKIDGAIQKTQDAGWLRSAEPSFSRAAPANPSPSPQRSFGRG